MKIKLLISICLSVLLTCSCDDTTDGLGVSLTNNLDKLAVSTDTFVVTSRSIIADSVLSMSTTGYLGKIKDPETGAYITGDYMTQFHSFEGYTFPDADSIVSKIDGEIVADSCELRLYYGDFFGDSLATMKLRVHEMSTPMFENSLYYSSFDPIKEGYIRADGIQKDRVYTLTDMNLDKSVRWGNDYSANIRVVLNDKYTDKNGKEYNNFGTYIMQSYYSHPEYFKNSYTFTKNVVPGLYVTHQGGLGSMAYINISQLNVYFRYITEDSIYNATASFAGTEEVLQTTRISNDKDVLKQLISDETCTYIKTPSGIFTELTLPIDEIMSGHERDSLNTAKLTLTSFCSTDDNGKALPAPSTLLLVPADSIITFFENNNTINYRTSFYASYSEDNNSYTFSNIGSLIQIMHKNRSSKNWNKVVLIPVTFTTNNSGAIVKVAHDMSLSSTRLVGGAANPHEPIKISVIYSKFE